MCLEIIYLIYVYKKDLAFKLAIVIKGDPKAPFSVATTLRCNLQRLIHHKTQPI